MTEDYGKKLEDRKKIFQHATKTAKSLNTVIISTLGIVDNSCKKRFVQNEVTLEDLFI